jgi:hypothetical protein
VENTYSLSVQAIRAAHSPDNLWSMLSFVLEHMNRLGLNLDWKFQDGDYIVKIEPSMKNIWSLFIRDFVVMIFQKLAKIEPKASINHNLTIIFSLPSSPSKSD